MDQRSLVTWQKAWPFVRDVLLFVGGWAGIAYETLHGPVDTSLLVIFGACIGLPFALHKDVDKDQ